MERLPFVLAHRIAGDPSKNPEIMIPGFGPRLLPHRAFMTEADLFQHAVRGGIARQRPGVEAVEAELLVAAANHGANRFGHQAFPPKLRMQLVSDLAASPFLLKAVEPDRAGQPAGFTILDDPCATLAGAVDPRPT